MAHSGKIYPIHTHVEIDEAGVIWLIQNHFESPSVIEEMQASSVGKLIVDDAYIYDEEDDDDFYDFQ